MVTSSLSPVARIPEYYMDKLHIEIFGLGLLAGLVCILLLYKRKKFTSKIIWRSLFLFCIILTLSYTLNIKKGCYEGSKFIRGIRGVRGVRGVCFNIKVLPKTTVPTIFES